MDRPLDTVYLLSVKDNNPVSGPTSWQQHQCSEEPRRKEKQARKMKIWPWAPEQEFGKLVDITEVGWIPHQK